MKIYAIMCHRENNCSYITSVHKSMRKAQEKIKKDFSNFKYRTNGEQECWHNGNKTHLDIDECELEE